MILEDAESLNNKKWTVQPLSRWISSLRNWWSVKQEINKNKSETNGYGKKNDSMGVLND